METQPDWRRFVSAAGKALIGRRGTVRARCVLRGFDTPRWGNLRRTTPFSEVFGFDRGTPIDRYYLDKFLDANRHHITGDVLEIQLPTYTERFGVGVRVAHTLDIRRDSQPTYVCDLAKSGDVVPTGRYDCFLLPNTAQHVPDLEPALHHALRVVRPGGVILASAAGFLPLISDGADYWRLTVDGWKLLASRVWPECQTDVQSHGNCLAAIASMHGLAAEELTTRELDVSDRRYPVLITVRCLKRL
jgi:SAM-dependent methyltransferase